jgi:ABC-2 type transport system ATP-binding protein
MRNSLSGQLSTGWRQRLALAAAIVHQPELLFLDEPTSGVDPIARRSFWELIYQLVESGVTALVTTHYMDEAEYCSRVGIMREGKLLAMDTPSALKQSTLQGTVWDITAEPLLPILDTLEKHPSVLRTRLAGDHLSAITKPETNEQVLVNAILSQGGEVGSIRKVLPSLEDVFLTLAEGSEYYSSYRGGRTTI